MKRIYICYPVLLLLTLLGVVGCTQDETYIEQVHTPELKLEKIGSEEMDKVTIRIEPNEYVSSYRFAIGQESDLSDFEEGVLTGTYEMLDNQVKTHEFGYLKPNSTYLIYAMPYDEDGKAGTLSTLKVKTFTDAFQVRLKRVNVTSAAVEIASTEDYYAYSYAIGTTQDRAAFLADKLSGTVIKNECTYYQANFFNLQPETKYVIYVQGYNRQNVPTRLFEIPIQTQSMLTHPAILPSSTFTIQDLLIAQCDLNLNKATFKASVLMRPSKDFDFTVDQIYQGDVLSMMVESTNQREVHNFKRGPHVYSEAVTRPLFTNPEPFGVGYDAYILLYDQNREPYSVEKLTYVSPAYDAKAPKAEVKVVYEGKQGKHAKFKLHTKNTIAVFYKFFPAQAIEELEKEGPISETQMFNTLLNAMRYAPGDQVLDVNLNVDGLPEGFELCVVACAVNKNGIGEKGRSEIVYEKVKL